MKAELNSEFLKGVIKAPPSKSLAHRAIICAALSKGQKTVLKNIELSNDIKATLNCVCQLGVRYNYEINKLTIFAPDEYKTECEMFCMESGSTFRFMMPIVSALKAKCTFDGIGKLPSRPYKILADVMEKNGAMFSAKKGLPVTLSGKIMPGEYKIKADESSQYISGLLFALPLLEGDSKIVIDGEIESKQYIDMTIDVLKKFSVEISFKDNEYFVKGNQSYKAHDFVNEGDYSNAAFFICAAALNGDIEIIGLNKDSIQADVKIVDIIKKMGGNIEFQDNILKVKKSPLKGIEYDFSQCVDIAPIASVTAALASGKSKFTGLRRLKIKESDREIATYNIIYNLGGKIRLIDDTFIIEGVKSFKGGVVCGYNDHRIVMSAAIAALKSEKEVVITDVQAINKSYNGFFDDYCGLGGKVNVFDVGR